MNTETMPMICKLMLAITFTTITMPSFTMNDLRDEIKNGDKLRTLVRKWCCEDCSDIKIKHPVNGTN